ncbi:putative quinol monooxygenase [Olivibacter sitiensis]|uniref:putative quinol monooxygenase n=1 Tax=Olivibacter sitiensis TaxID=376470 RepID=UPI000413798D|nr:putative quinol monooxygenase [Olivibacter sitiensis]
MPIYLIATLKSKSEYRQDIKAMLENMVVQTRKEEANLRYDLHQGIEDENLFVFYEIWADDTGLSTHNARDYIQDFVASEGKLQEPVQIYKTRLLPATD